MRVYSAVCRLASFLHRFCCLEVHQFGSRTRIDEEVCKIVQPSFFWLRIYNAWLRVLALELVTARVLVRFLAGRFLRHVRRAILVSVALFLRAGGNNITT